MDTNIDYCDFGACVIEHDTNFAYNVDEDCPTCRAQLRNDHHPIAGEPLLVAEWLPEQVTIQPQNIPLVRNIRLPRNIPLLQNIPLPQDIHSPQPMYPLYSAFTGDPRLIHIVRLSELPEGSRECIICRNPLSDYALEVDDWQRREYPAYPPCDRRHVFGHACLYKWIKSDTNCPLCRCSFNIDWETGRPIMSERLDDSDIEDEVEPEGEYMDEYEDEFRGEYGGEYGDEFGDEYGDENGDDDDEGENDFDFAWALPHLRRWFNDPLGHEDRADPVYLVEVMPEDPDNEAEPVIIDEPQDDDENSEAEPPIMSEPGNNDEAKPLAMGDPEPNDEHSEPQYVPRDLEELQKYIQRELYRRFR